MTADSRAALNKLIAALERHYEASAARREEDDPMVVAAYDDLADAFEAYDDALNDAFGEMTPLIVIDDLEAAEDDDTDVEDDYDDEDDSAYSGLDDEDYDSEDDAEGPATPRA